MFGAARQVSREKWVARRTCGKELATLKKKSSEKKPLFAPKEVEAGGEERCVRVHTVIASGRGGGKGKSRKKNLENAPKTTRRTGQASTNSAEGEML